jgi:hypothetical protein
MESMDCAPHRLIATAQPTRDLLRLEPVIGTHHQDLTAPDGECHGRPQSLFEFVSFLLVSFRAYKVAMPSSKHHLHSFVNLSALKLH